MRIIVITIALSLTACQPDLTPEIERLQAQLARQQAEIDRLTAFVDTQAEVIVVCQRTLVGITDYLINMGTLGMLREAESQLVSIEECTDALAQFNAIAAQRPGELERE